MIIVFEAANLAQTEITVQIDRRRIGDGRSQHL
jgi:hypothetical protein